jgi:WhiB family redox-sensing transcriptional regulator
MGTSAVRATPDRARRPDWRDDAACLKADPELFFPDRGIGPVRAQVKLAKLICRGCPVNAICLNWALDSGESGIWGGLTEDERRRLQRRAGHLRPAANY